MNFKVKIDKKALAEITGKFGSIGKAVTKTDAQEIGTIVVEQMKGAIKDGLSPIQGAGRFPAYKAVALANDIRGDAKGLKAEARGLRKYSKSKKFDDKGRSIRQAARRISDASATVTAFANEVEASGYPASVQKKYPHKRNRPINLYLSGDFLKSLTWKPFPTQGGGNGVEIFFNDPDSDDKEQGHREGAGGQPKRPIMPNYDKGETFLKSIEVQIIEVVESAIERALK